MVLEHDAAVGLVPSTGAPPSVMLPSWASSRPRISRSSVDLPQPLAPTTATNWPAGMRRSMPDSTCSAPPSACALA